MKSALIILSLVLGFPAWAQDEVPQNKTKSTQAYLKSFLSVDLSVESSASSLNEFLKKLEKKKISIKNEKEFLRYVFAKTHQVYLKQFVGYAQFNTLFSDGSYNCLTGTILYTLILNHFNLKHEVIETNYHIFILAETSQGNILLEVTDPYHGFVDSSYEIEVRISRYKQNALYAANNNLAYYKFNFDLYNPVSTDELRGLLYYNKAVDAYNHQKLKESIQYLAKAAELYSSSRIDEFSQILILSLRQSALDDHLKEEYLKTIFAVRQKASGAMAMVP